MFIIYYHTTILPISHLPSVIRVTLILLTFSGHDFHQTDIWMNVAAHFITATWMKRSASLLLKFAVVVIGCKGLFTQTKTIPIWVLC